MSRVPTGEKGHALEEILKEYFWQAGYFVVRGVPYRIDDEDVTDIDLWLYERPAALTRRRLIVDVKNRKSPRAAERIIWTKGLQAAARADDAIVATTDARAGVDSLARSLNITLLDGKAITKLSNSTKLQPDDILSSEDLERSVKRIDDARRSTQWRQSLRELRASLVFETGVQSLNRCLSMSGLFAEQALLAPPGSEQASIALRLFYHSSSLAAINLDFILAGHAFQSQEERRKTIVEGIRYGQSGASQVLSTVKVALGLARKYADNGAVVSKQIERNFIEDAEKIPAEIIADYAAKASTSDAIFNVAREIERASHKRNLILFDHFGVETKSLLGTFLDFNGISREKIATIIVEESPVVDAIEQESGTLFTARE